ncbi:hypothetical protein RDABS01_035584 [Bienertia sinuspersici]
MKLHHCGLLGTKRTCGFFCWADEVTYNVCTMLMEKDEKIAELQHEKKALEK